MPKGPHKPDQNGPPPTRKGQAVPLTEKELDILVEDLRQHGVLMWSCRTIGRSYSGILARMKRDPNFAQRVQESIDEATASIEMAAIERGVKGVERLEVSAGQIVKDDQGNPVTRREYSDTLLLAVLRARDQRFRSKQSIDVNHSHSTNGAVISTDDIWLLEPSDRDQFLHLLSKIEAKRRGDGEQKQLTGSVEDAEFSDADGEELDADEAAELAAIL